METRTVYDDLPGNWLPPAGALAAFWFLAACLLSRSATFPWAGAWLRPENASTEAVAVAVVCMLLGDVLLWRRRATELKSFESGQPEGWCHRGIDFIGRNLGVRHTREQAREGVRDLSLALNRQLDLRWFVCYLGPLVLLPLPATLLAWHRYLHLSGPIAGLPAVTPAFNVLFGPCIWASLTSAALGLAALSLRLRWAALVERWSTRAVLYEDRRFVPPDGCEPAPSTNANGSVHGSPQRSSSRDASTARGSGNISRKDIPSETGRTGRPGTATPDQPLEMGDSEAPPPIASPQRPNPFGRK